jgi:YidC/Oxa1 family membrane protein insertase
MSNPFAFLAVPANLLIAGLTHLLTNPFGTAATAVAIVAATILVRLLLLPLGYAQHRADQRRNALLRKVAELRERHARRPERLEVELTALYQAEGAGLVRGCLPILAQIPVFAALYQVFVSPTIGGQANVLLQQTLFGVPLGAHLASAGGPHVFVFGAMIGLLALIAYLSTRLLHAKGLVAHAVPYLIPVFATILPLAASLYLVTTTAWTLAQTVLLRHWIS